MLDADLVLNNTLETCSKSIELLEACQIKLRKLLAEEPENEHDAQASRHLIYLTNETLRLTMELRRMRRLL